jgi:hypothetical protein
MLLFKIINYATKKITNNPEIKTFLRKEILYNNYYSQIEQIKLGIYYKNLA